MNKINDFRTAYSRGIYILHGIRYEHHKLNNLNIYKYLINQESNEVKMPPFYESKFSYRHCIYLVLKYVRETMHSISGRSPKQ